VKKLAKLALFFSCSFALLLILAAAIRFLALRVDWARNLPQQPEILLSEIIAAVRWALSLAIYGSLLLSLGYAALEYIFAPVTILCLYILSLGFSLGVSLGLEYWGNVPPALISHRQLGGPGLILANALHPTETVVVLLKGPSEPFGPRVAAIPDRPLSYQAATPEPVHSAAALPPLPFRNDIPWFLKSLSIDLRLNSEYLRQRLNEGLLPFLIYAGALIFFLGSLGFIHKFSAWPLANLFLGCLAFRGILALETFFNSAEMQEVFDSFLKDRLPPSLTVPLIFCAFGILVHLYSLLVYFAKRRGNDEKAGQQ
jgi:hypothetical protein